MALAESLLRLEEVEALKGCGVEVEEEKLKTEHRIREQKRGRVEVERKKGERQKSEGREQDSNDEAPAFITLWRGRQMTN